MRKRVYRFFSTNKIILFVVVKTVQSKQTALHVAAKNRREECLRMLLEAKADVDAHARVVQICVYRCICLISCIFMPSANFALPIS